MIPEVLLPRISNLALDRLELEEDRLNLIAKPAQLSSCCPLCNTISTKVHSNYTRQLSDLPWAGLEVKVILKVHKFFCLNDSCERKIFTQRIEGLSSHIRRTQRQASQLLEICIATGGNRGAKLSSKLGMPVSASTILRLLNAQTTPDYETPRVLGVDDWAIRKGQVYGTILVDMEKQKPIDLLEGREAEALEAWLNEHPGVEIISRDRASDYATASSKAAPDAKQVADRWHLLKNLTDAIKRMMDKHNEASRKVAIDIAQQELLTTDNQNTQGIDTIKENPIIASTKKQEFPSKYELIFEVVKKLQKEGISQRAISRQLGVSRKTVCKYFEYDEFPKRINPPSQESKAAKFDSFLRKRWNEGERNYHQLWREIIEEGFDGSFVSLYKYMVKQFPKDRSKTAQAKPKIKVYSARRLSFLLCREKDNLKPKEENYLQKLFDYCPEAKTANDLALRYRDILLNRKPNLLDDWITDAIESGKKVLGNLTSLSKAKK